ncbi:MAG: hypothetical protein CTR54_17210 [Rhizobium sp.]|nr:MAG: hypothetical protein CTR54_17210 [Rhizobium sp.]
MLTRHIRELLIDQAQTGRTITYKELALDLGLTPPQTIHRVTEALEILMAEDVAAGRPLLAALCVSRLSHGLPARGFFATAEMLGLFRGDPAGTEARTFYDQELKRALMFYSRL